MKGKVNCTCGWSWNKSDSSVKDMYICHECGRDNSNNIPKAQEGKKVVAESTGVYKKPFNEKELKNILKDELEYRRTGDIKNPRAEANKFEKFLPNKKTANFFKKMKKEAGPAIFKEALKIQHERGNPFVNVGTDKGLPFSNLRNYNPFTNEVNIPADSPGAYENHIYDYLKEVSHAGQPLSEVIARFLTNDIPGYVKAYISKGNTNDNIEKYVYDNPKTIENYTHSKIQPELEKRINSSYSWPMSEAEELEDLNLTLKYDLPKQKNGGWLENYNDSKASAPEGMVGDGFSNVGRNYSPAWGGQFQEGGEIPMAQNGDRATRSDSLAMRGMMKSKIGMGNAFEHPAIKRMSQAMPKTGMTPEGIGTHYMSSIDNYAVPLLQDLGEEELTLIDPDSRSKEAIRFNSPEEAQYFAEHYKDVAPMSTTFKGLQEYAMGGSIPGAVGFSYARTQSPAPSNGKYAKKTMPSAQGGKKIKIKDERLEGKVVKDNTNTKLTIKEKPITKELKKIGDDQKKIEDAKAYYKKYLNSPKAGERITNMMDDPSGSKYAYLYDDDEVNPVDQEIKNRLAGLNKLQGKFDYANDFGTDSSSYYDTKKNSVFIRPNSDINIGYNNPEYTPHRMDVDNVIGHEIGHGIQQASNKDSNNLWYRNGISRKESNMLMRANIGIINSKNREEILNDKDNPEYKYDLDHDNKPSELKADIDALRYQLYRQGIYDAGTQDFTREHLEKAKPTFVKSRLNKHFTDDELIDLMNKLSYNEINSDGITPIAQNGQEMKYYQEGLDWKPKTISKNGGWLDGYEKAQNGVTTGDKVKYGTPEYEQAYNRGEVVTEDGQYSPILLDEVVIPSRLTEFGKTRKEIAAKNTWEQFSQKFLGNFEKNMGQTLENLPESRKQEYEEYINKLAFDEYVKTHPMQKGEKRGAYIDRMQTENANSSNFKRAYETNANYNDVTDINKWRKSLIGLGSIVLPKFAMDPLKQNSDYFSTKEKEDMRDNLISTRFNDVLGTIEPLTIPVEGIYGNKSFGQIASGENADIPMSARILADPMMLAFEAAPLIGAGFKTVGRALGAEEGLIGKVSQEVNINRNLSKIKKEGKLQGLSDYEIAKKQMEQVGITSNQRKGYTPVVSEFFEKYIKPRNYTGTEASGQNKFQEIIENIKKGGYKEAYPERIDAWKLYLGRPQVNKTFSLADTAPAIHPSYKTGSLEGMDIYNIKSKGVTDRINFSDNYIPDNPRHLDVLENAITIDRDAAIMGGYNKLLTKQGTQYNDIWDLEPAVNLKTLFPNAISENSRFENIFYKTLSNGVQSPRGFKIPVEKFVGKPFMSHGNLPYTSTEHVNLLRENILSKIESFKPQVNTAFEGPQRMAKMQADLKDLENYPKYKQGGIIKDDRGQWDHPGEITEINSNEITMGPDPKTGKPLTKPLLGISDTGDVKLMRPGGNYKFDGKRVTEYPIAQGGLTMGTTSTENDVRESSAQSAKANTEAKRKAKLEEAQLLADQRENRRNLFARDIKVRQPDGEIKIVNTGSPEYEELYKAGDIQSPGAGEGDTPFFGGQLNDVVVQQKMTPLLKGKKDYEYLSNKEAFVNRKKDEYIKSLGSRGNWFGATRSNFPETVLSRINREYDYNQNTRAIEDVAKAKGFDLNTRGEWIYNLTPGEKEALINSKYSAQLNPNEFSEMASGVQQLGNVILPGKPFNFKVPGLTQRELEEDRESMLSPLKTLAPLNILGNTAANYLKNSSDYVDRPFLGTQRMGNVDVWDSMAFNPISYMGVEGLVNLPSAAYKGTRTLAAALGENASNIKKVMPTVKEVAKQLPKAIKKGEVPETVFRAMPDEFKQSPLGRDIQGTLDQREMLKNMKKDLQKTLDVEGRDQIRYDYIQSPWDLESQIHHMDRIFRRTMTDVGGRELAEIGMKDVVKFQNESPAFKRFEEIVFQGKPSTEAEMQAVLKEIADTMPKATNYSKEAKKAITLRQKDLLYNKKNVQDLKAGIKASGKNTIDKMKGKDTDVTSVDPVNYSPEEKSTLDVIKELGKYRKLFQSHKASLARTHPETMKNVNDLILKLDDDVVRNILGADKQELINSYKSISSSVKQADANAAMAQKPFGLDELQKTAPDQSGNALRDFYLSKYDAPYTSEPSLVSKINKRKAIKNLGYEFESPSSLPQGLVHYVETSYDLKPPTDAAGNVIDANALVLKSEGNAKGQIKNAMTIVNEALPGENVIGAHNLSTDSYALTLDAALPYVKKGRIKVKIDPDELQTNPMGYATNFPGLALKDINSKIEAIEKASGVKIPRAKYNADYNTYEFPKIYFTKIKKNGGYIDRAKHGNQLVKLDQLTNFTNYNKPQPGGWLNKYN